MRSLVSSHDVTYILQPLDLSTRGRTDFCKSFDGSHRSKKSHVSDTDYLFKLIDFLKLQRQLREISSVELNRKSKLGKNVIDFAESGKRIPSTREFKSWSAALGFKWEDVWSLVLLPHLELSC